MPHLELDDDQRYRALRSRDRRFDGLFIVGVRTTGIYCRPSCPTPVQPLRRNVDFFATSAAAQRAGLRACKRCRPDASPGSPEWNVRDDLVGRAMRMIIQGYLDTHRVAELAGELGVAERHLRRLMIESVGAPPLALARAQRAQTARTLIETTSMRFTDVAFASGFASLRQFNDTVREVFASTPTELRRTTSATKTDGGQLALRLPFRSPVASDHLLGWWSHRTVGGVAEVRDGALHTALRLRAGDAVASLRFLDDWVACHIVLEDVADLGPAVAQCRSLLDLDADPAHIDHVISSVEPLARLVASLSGIRSPGSSDGFATLVFAVLGQQRSVAAARTLANRIVDRVQGSSDRLRPFPGPSAVRAADLGGLGLTERNVETIHAVADRFDGREPALSPGADRREVRDELVGIKGIGPWTADYVAMRALGHPDIFLAGDLVADRAASSLGLDRSRETATSPWRSYLTHHLWAASAALNATTQKAPTRSAAPIKRNSMKLHKTTIDSPVGQLELVADDHALVAVLWPEERQGRVRFETEPESASCHPVLEQAAAQLIEYFAGSRRTFDLPIDPRGTEFQQQVWRSLTEIPYGETSTYAEQAANIGRASAVRAVGSANGRNPLSIVLPCHRIIGADGKLTGFAGGIETKRWLLDHEAAHAS